ECCTGIASSSPRPAFAEPLRSPSSACGTRCGCPKIIGRRGLTTSAISAIDIGLWDIRAKVARLPLYKLLGGFRDRMPTYIAGGYYEEGKGIRELQQEMETNVKLGARAQDENRRSADTRRCRTSQRRARSDW